MPTQLGTWNDWTICARGVVAQVTREMGHYGIEITGIIDCTRNGTRKLRLTTSETAVHVGQEKKHRGRVAVLC